ncbi:MAG TPA: guanylate kinase [Thermoanaerobaculia bacterium]|nr:guanylate kinase [Thermoanaerobaculia bacterium]
MSNRTTLNFHPDGTLFIVSGPSGAGKSTLIQRVKKALDPLGVRLHFSVSHTTRSIRAGEQEGVDYHYVTEAAFEAMAVAGEFLEWARVHGNLYGTSIHEVRTRLDRGEDVILDIDVQGARQIAANDALRPHSLSLFLFPPSFEELARRLKGRALNSSKDIEMRLQKALSEIEHGSNFYDYVVINDDVDIATECLKAAIVARKLTSKSALQALQQMARRFKGETNGSTA